MRILNKTVSFSYFYSCPLNAMINLKSSLYDFFSHFSTYTMEIDSTFYIQSLESWINLNNIEISGNC